MSDSVKYVLDDTRLPKSWYNLMADLPSPPPPVLHPGTLAAGGTGRPGAALSDVADHAGGLDRARDRDPGAGPRRVPAVAPEPAVSGPSSREGAADAGAHLLQVRGRESGGQPQAQHGRRAGLLQQGGGHQEDRDRDRCRAVGIGARVRRRDRSASRSSCSWCACRTTRSRIAARSWKRLARAASRARRRRPVSAGRCSRATPDSNGSLGIAISEAVEVAAGAADTNYALGSVLNHVLLHQTVIGQEAIAQMEMADDYPDIVVGCTGGGSNFAGIAFPFIGAQLRGGKKCPRRSRSSRPRARA